jgi:pyruvate dehydrogenase E2 component (dihydrolipoamide acetyltransferase)
MANNASPVARRLAARHGVTLDGLSGSGPGGRVVKADVERAAQPGPLDAGDEVTVEPLTSVQSTIAARITAAKATVPDFTLTTEVEMDAALELRSHLSELGLDPLPSINDLVLKACAVALRAHPRVNASYGDGTIEIHRRVNIAVAVPAPDALLVPVVADADAKTLAQITVETRALAQLARTGSLTPDQVSGATFTISNLGMYGVTQFSAILNPPQAAILAVGSVREHGLVLDGGLVSRRQMSLTATCDHRILYGADAATFVQSIKTTLEQPLRLLV